MTLNFENYNVKNILSNVIKIFETPVHKSPVVEITSFARVVFSISILNTYYENINSS